MDDPPPPLASVCVYCSSSQAAPAAWGAAAAELGRILANAGLRLVYGGGGVGLMGECARAARAAGGRVLGVIPRFLIAAEAARPGPDTVVVSSMHARKMLMFEESDAFAILPGAIGTLEEAIELLSWRRLALHAKPIVFFNPDQFWRPLFELFDAFVQNHLLPTEFDQCWGVTSRIEEVLPKLRAMPSSAFKTPPAISLLV